MNLKERINTQIVPELSKEFGKSKLELPMIEKIVINVGFGPYRNDKNILESMKNELSRITGQYPKFTKSKKSISGFKLRENDLVGYVVTLRGSRMYDFLDKTISLALPRIRDFRGLKADSFDKSGNYTFAIREHVIYPEIHQEDVSAIWGMAITITFKNSQKEINKALLEKIGMPLEKR